LLQVIIIFSLFLHSLIITSDKTINAELQ